MKNDNNKDEVKEKTLSTSITKREDNQNVSFSCK
jgi:hypothetical protein